MNRICPMTRGNARQLHLIAALGLGKWAAKFFVVLRCLLLAFASYPSSVPEFADEGLFLEMTKFS